MPWNVAHIKTNFITTIERNINIWNKAAVYSYMKDFIQLKTTPNSKIKNIYYIRVEIYLKRMYFSTKTKK